jgi:riboflavin-specific deaminase-like protein
MFYEAAELGFPTTGVPFQHQSKSLVRPYVIFNMVASVDGKTTTRDGTLTGLSSRFDRQIMRQIRAGVDAILVGGKTLRHDPFVPTLSEALLKERQRSQPLGVVVSRSGDFPVNHRFWSGDRKDHLVFATGNVPDWLPQKAEVVIFSGDLAEVLDILHDRFQVRVLLVEGGASLNYQFVQQGWADEFFITLSPVLVGGDDNLGILGGAGWGMGNRLQGLELVSVHQHQDELYLRYRLRH